MHASAPTHDQYREQRTDTALLILIALAFLILHVAVGSHYGFQRDELATLEDARHLAAGYVAYPPVTPFFGRISLELFGTSLRGFRFFAALAHAVICLLAGLMARELGGRRFAQVVAALAVAISPVSLASGVLMQYVAFDYLSWALTAYLLIRLMRTGNPVLWVPIGLAIGFGMMSKYTMVFFVAAIVVSLLLTDARRYLASKWLWIGAALSLLVFLPNLLWQIQHHFVSLDFLHHIHARDVRIGRTKHFLQEQMFIPANLFTIPLWIAGLFFYFRSPEGRAFRMIGWVFVVTLLIFFVAHGRSYYIAPAYPMLLAAGAVLEERWLNSLAETPARVMRVVTATALIVGGVVAASITLPLVPINSHWFQVAGKINSDFREEVGWPELVAEVARVYRSVPPGERARTGIIAANYGEAGAINLYGPAYGLPRVISGINSFWYEGYPSPPPQTLIVIGFGEEYRNEYFQSCDVVGRTPIPYGIQNEEAERPNIYLCRQLRQPWPDFWKDFRYYG